MEICAPPSPFIRDIHTPETAISEACSAALRDDFNVQEAEFSDESLRWLDEGLYSLLARDAGPWPPSGRHTSADYVGALSAWHITGYDTRQALYDMAANTPAYTVYYPIEGAAARYQRDGDLLIFSDPVFTDSITIAALIVHEVAHDITDRGHIACEDGRLACDENWAGPYGFQAAAGQAWQDHIWPDDPNETSVWWSAHAAIFSASTHIFAEK